MSNLIFVRELGYYVNSNNIECITLDKTTGRESLIFVVNLRFNSGARELVKFTEEKFAKEFIEELIAPRGAKCGVLKCQTNIDKDTVKSKKK